MGTDDAEQKKEDDASASTTWGVDYSYFTTEGNPIPHRNQRAIELARRAGTLRSPVLALYDRKTRTGYLHQTTSNGRADQYVLQRAIDDIDEAGYIARRIVVKSDHEPAIELPLKDIAQGRPEGQTVIEEATN